MIHPSFWRGRRVFLTGHTGFKGSWLSLWLHRMGAHVTGYALPAPTDPSLFETARVADVLDHVEGDVRDLDHLSRQMAMASPEIVLHLAAQPLVRASYADPVGTYASNIMGTVHVCEAVRRTPGVRALLCVTSDKCYANQEWDWAYRENEPMGGHDPYSASKGCSELVAASFRESFFPVDAHAHHGVALATARAGNVIGGGDWAEDRLIPDLLRAHVAGTSVRLRHPGATRPWQHVLDALTGYLLLAERLVTHGPACAGAWNFGPDASDVRPVADIARHLGDALSLRLELDTPPSALHEAHALRLDSAKARHRLGWRPAWPLDAALDRVVAWHRAWHEGRDMRAITLHQIDDHLSCLGITDHELRPAHRHADPVVNGLEVAV